MEDSKESINRLSPEEFDKLFIDRLDEMDPIGAVESLNIREYIRERGFFPSTR